MWRVRRPAGGPVTGTGSLRGSSFRLPCKRTTASSRLTSLRPPSRHPRAPSRPPPSRSLSPSFSVRSFSSSVNPPLRLPLGPILCALAPLSSLVRSFVRPTDRPLLCPPLCLSSSRRHHHPPRLLCSFARKRCHTRETAHRLFIPAPLLSLAHRSATRAQLRAVRLFSTVLSFPLSHLAKQRSCRVFASSFFLLLSPPSPRRPPTAPTVLQRHRHRRRSPPRPPLLLLCISRSSFSDRTGNTSRWTHNYLSHATTWAVRGWEGRGPKMNGRAGGRTPSRTKRS